jgi:hypothetical protein
MLIYFIYNYERKASAIYETYPQALPDKLKRIGWDYKECMVRIAPDLSFAIRNQSFAKDHPETLKEEFKGMVFDDRQLYANRRAISFDAYTMTNGKGVHYV